MRTQQLSLTFTLLLLLGFAAAAQAQEKGVDTQNSSIRDAGSGRSAGSNGTKQDTGSGRGVNFGKGRTPATITIPNPYRLAARRDAVIQATTDYLKERGIVLDQDTSRLNEGLLITQPFVFAKGSSITQSKLEQYADLPETEATNRGWTRARHILVIEIQPIDGTAVNLSVNVKIEGRVEGPTGTEWVSLRSNGNIEQETISNIVAAVTGNNPTTPMQP